MECILSEMDLNTDGFVLNKCLVIDAKVECLVKKNPLVVASLICR